MRLSELPGALFPGDVDHYLSCSEDPTRCPMCRFKLWLLWPTELASENVCPHSKVSLGVRVGVIGWRAYFPTARYRRTVVSDTSR